MNANKLLYDFLSDQDISDLSYRQYKSNIKLFLEWLTKKKLTIKEVTTADIIKYKKHLEYVKRHTELSTAGHLMTIRLFFRWYERNGYGSDVTRHVKINKHYNTFRKKSLTPEQVKKFLKQFPTETMKDKRDYAIMLLMLTNGLRVIEVIRINICDFTELYGFRAIALQRKGKKEKDSILPLSEKAWEATKIWLTARKDAFDDDDDPVFISLAVNGHNRRLSPSYISTMIKKKLNQAGITGKYYTAHSLRHTTATHLIANGFSEYQVQTFMGHANFSTTQIYTLQREKEMIFKAKPNEFLDKNLITV